MRSARRSRDTRVPSCACAVSATRPSGLPRLYRVPPTRRDLTCVEVQASESALPRPQSRRARGLRPHSYRCLLRRLDAHARETGRQSRHLCRRRSPASGPLHGTHLLGCQGRLRSRRLDHEDAVPFDHHHRGDPWSASDRGALQAVLGAKAKNWKHAVHMFKAPGPPTAHSRSTPAAGVAHALLRRCHLREFAKCA